MGSGSSDQSFGIAIDGSGNVYTTGSFNGTVDFDPGPGASNMTSSDGFDIFVSKLDSDGSFLWARRIGGTTDIERVRGIAVDSSGNVYTTGGFEHTLDFDPSAGGTSTLTSAGFTDIFVWKLDTDGNFVWAKRLGGPSNTDEGRSIAVDGSDNVHTTGESAGIADFDPGNDTFNLTFISATDIFVSKLDSDGNFLWAKSMGGTGTQRGLGIAVDGSGNVLTTGGFVNTVDFNPPAGGVSSLTSVGGSDVFVSKLDSNGNFLWARCFCGPGSNRGRGIAVDGSGNVYTARNVQGTADFDPGPGVFNLLSNGNRDVFVSKLDSDGKFVWAQGMGGIGFDDVNGFALDGSGNAHTTGGFNGTVDFDPGSDIVDLTSNGNQDIFVLKLDSNGDFVWAKSMGGTGTDLGSGIAVGGGGNVHAIGFFRTTVDFDPGSGIVELTSNGNTDIFVLKLAHQPTSVGGTTSFLGDDSGLSAGAIIGFSAAAAIVVALGASGAWHTRRRRGEKA